MYGFWDTEHDRQNFFAIFDHFLHFYPLTTQKTKILKNWKIKPGDIIISRMCSKNMDPMM